MTDSEPLTITDLLPLVQQLTTGTRPTGHRSHVRPALLQQLRDAVTPDPGGTGRSKPDNERSVINAGALDLYDYLVGQIEQLYDQATGTTPHGAPDELLLAWWSAVVVDDTLDPLNTAQLATLHDRLDTMITRIRDLLESPAPVEITGTRCPECGVRRTPHGAALTRLTRPWKDNETTVTCRACNATWTGHEAIAMLGDLLDHPELQLAEIRHPSSPDCRETKHHACTGTAWDNPNDRIVTCGCPCHQPEDT